MISINAVPEILILLLFFFFGGAPPPPTIPMLGLSQSLVSSIAGALMVEQRPNTAEPDNLPTALWDVSQHARESGGTRYHYLASDTAGSDLVVSQACPQSPSHALPRVQRTPWGSVC